MATILQQNICSGSIPLHPTQQQLKTLASLSGLSGVERNLAAYWCGRGGVPSYQRNCFVHMWAKHRGGSYER